MNIDPRILDDFVKPFDLEVMNFCMEDTKMNILHICDWEGVYDDLTRYAASEAIASGPGGKMMLGAECTVSDAPMANIHVAIATAHHGGQVSF